MTKTVVYARISSIEQHIDSQVAAIEEYCKKYDFKIEASFEDIITGSSKVTDRENFSKLLIFLENNPDVRNLVCFEYSRLGRSFIDTYAIIGKLKESSVNIHFIKENLNTLNTTADDTLRLNLLSSIAEYEREQIKTRTKRGRTYKILNQGAPSGSLPQYGYRKESGKLVKDDDEAKIVELIFSLYVQKGYSTPEIAKRLNSDKIKTKYAKQVESGLINPKDGRLSRNNFAWTDGTVARLLKKKIFIGLRQYTDLNLPHNPILQIIDIETFNNAQKKLEEQKKVNPNASKFENVLRGCIKCPCGNGYQMHKGNSSKAHHYKCTNKECDAPFIDIDLLNNVVYFFLKSAVRDDEKLESKIQEIQKKIIDIEAVQLTNLEQISNLKKKVKIAYEDRLDNIIDVENFIEFNHEISSRIAEKEEEYRKNDKTIASYRHEIEEYKINAEYSYNSPEIFKKHIKGVIEKIVVSRVTKNDLLKKIFPEVRQSNLLHVTINSGIYGFHECLVNYNHDYFLFLIGKCFDNYNNFIGGSLNERFEPNIETGIAELISDITILWVKVDVPKSIQIGI